MRPPLLVFASAASGLALWLASCLGPNPAFRAEHEETSSSGDGASTEGSTSASLSEWRFDSPIAIHALNSDAEERSPTLSPDEREVIFASDRLGDGFDLFVATRRRPSEDWEDPRALESLNSRKDELAPRLSDDGLLLLFASDRRGASSEIFYATRESARADWAPPAALQLRPSDAPTWPARMTEDLLSVVFSRRAMGRRGSDLMLSRRASVSDPFGAAEALSALNSDAEEGWAWLDETAFRILFVSDRFGTDDLWASESRGSTFLPPEPLQALNTDASESDPWLSADASTLYFASDRDGSFDLFAVTVTLAQP